MSSEPFVIERVLNASIEKVWNALTDKDEMKKWYFDLDAFNPELGFHFKFAGKGAKGEEYIHFCEITELVPQKKIAYSWRYEGYHGNSVVRFELTAKGDKTHLKLTHEGLETFPQDNPDFAKDSFSKGWTELIGTLLPTFLKTS